MINNSFSVNSQVATSVQADVKTSQQQQANISDVVEVEVPRPEKVVSQTAGTEHTKEEEGKATLTPEASQAKVEKAVASLNAFVQLMDRNVSFQIDDTSGRDVVSVFEKETKELIRQIPSEETLKLLERMDKMVGVLFDSQV